MDAIVDGRLPIKMLEAWITARVPLEDVQNGAMQGLEENKSKHMKVLIQVNELE